LALFADAIAAGQSYRETARLSPRLCWGFAATSWMGQTLDCPDKPLNTIVLMSAPTEHEAIVVQAVGDLIDLTIGAIRDRARTVTAPDELFHFTDADGTIGILNNGVFWASLSTALNDASEQRYTLDLAMNLLRSGKLGTGSFFDGLSAYLVDPTLIPIYAIRAQAFIVSFCSDADSASQWLHYGRQGNGIALSFNGEGLSETKDCDLVPILYDPIQQEKFLVSLITAAASRVASDTAKIPDPFAKALTDAVAHLVAQSIRIIASAHLKAPAFRHENEWRLVTLEFEPDKLPEHLRSRVATIRYRSRNHRIVPYIEMPLSTPSPLTSIVLGHSNPMEDGEAALRLLWERTVKGTPNIARSPVTVRP
jgi:hypothetical protein